MKKKNPADITLRNLRAMKKQHLAMVKDLEATFRIYDCWIWIDRLLLLEERIEFLERKRHCAKRNRVMAIKKETRNG